MKTKYEVKVINGIYTNLEGFTYDAKPNPYGNVMVYSKKGSNPYRVCLNANDVKYIK